MNIVRDQEQMVTTRTGLSHGTQEFRRDINLCAAMKGSSACLGERERGKHSVPKTCASLSRKRTYTNLCLCARKEAMEGKLKSEEGLQ